MRKGIIFTLLIFFIIFPLTSSAKVVGEYPKEGKVINSWEGELFPLINGAYFRYVVRGVTKEGKVWDRYVFRDFLINISTYKYYLQIKKLSKSKLVEMLTNKNEKKFQQIASLKKEQLLSLIIFKHAPAPKGPFYILRLEEGATPKREYPFQEVTPKKTFINFTFFTPHFNRKTQKMEYQKASWGEYLPLKETKLGDTEIHWLSRSIIGNKTTKKGKGGLEYEVIGQDILKIGKDRFFCYVIGIWPIGKRDGDFGRLISYPLEWFWLAPDIGKLKKILIVGKKEMEIEKLIEYYRPDKNFWWYTSEKIVPDIPPYVKGVDRRPYPRITDDKK